MFGLACRSEHGESEQEKDEHRESEHGESDASSTVSIPSDHECIDDEYDYLLEDALTSTQEWVLSKVLHVGRFRLH